MTNQSTICTLTLNPTIDVSYEISTLVPDNKNRAKSSYFGPGGNGINVARALKLLEQEVHTCCVLAGETGGFLLGLLQNRGIEPDYVEVPGNTRINGTVQQRRPPAEYKIGGVGPAMTQDALDEITDRFLKYAGTGYGVLSGSITEGVPEDIYAQLAEKLKAQGARAVVDCSSDMLATAVEAEPYLIKPNHYELELICGRSLTTIEQIAQEARNLQEKGVEIVCVSMGRQGAVIVDSNNSHYATAPKIHLRCTTGVGDAMLAGLITKLSSGATSSEALPFGLACGSGAAMSSAGDLFDPQGLEPLLAEIELKDLGI